MAKNITVIKNALNFFLFTVHLLYNINYNFVHFCEYYFASSKVEIISLTSLMCFIAYELIDYL